MVNSRSQQSTSRPLIFGEVLFDQFPDGSRVLGGAPFNVAWHLQAFGLAPVLVSRVGDDALGDLIRAAMSDWGMDKRGLQRDAQHPTGTVKITLQDGQPDFDIVAESAYDFIDTEQLPTLESVALLYHGSLALRHPVSLQALRRLQSDSAAPAFVDVNLRPPWWRRDQVIETLRRARWAKLNEDELAVLSLGNATQQTRAETLMANTALELLIVTQGAQGARIYSADNGYEQIRPEPVAGLVDTVGAGDAFSSVVILGLLNNWPLTLILKRAQRFAGGIVTQRGATVSDPAFYESFKTAWGMA